LGEESVSGDIVPSFGQLGALQVAVSPGAFDERTMAIAGRIVRAIRILDLPSTRFSGDRHGIIS
jgi:hypothetical protein